MATYNSEMVDEYKVGTVWTYKTYKEPCKAILEVLHNSTLNKGYSASYGLIINKTSNDKVIIN